MNELFIAAILMVSASASDFDVEVMAVEVQDYDTMKECQIEADQLNRLGDYHFFCQGFYNHAQEV